jgi:hypothetical protein
MIEFLSHFTLSLAREDFERNFNMQCNLTVAYLHPLLENLLRIALMAWIQAIIMR